MALIVEDGTLVAGAESYLSVADASTYHTARGNAAWAALASDTVREQALRRATQYMEQMYRMRWKGYRVASTQSLSWPRANVVMPDGPFSYGYETMLAITLIPKEIKDATAEFALRAGAADLAPDLERGTLSETVGPISVTYDPASPEYSRYRAVEAMLAPYLTGGSINAKLVRS